MEHTENSFLSCTARSIICEEMYYITFTSCKLQLFTRVMTFVVSNVLFTQFNRIPVPEKSVIIH